MKRWFVLFSTMVMLVPATSGFASGEGTSIKREGSRLEVKAPHAVTLEERYAFLLENGILKGKKDGKAQFDSSLTRAELAVSLFRLFKLEEVKDTSPYQDVKKHWAKDAILAITKKGWMEGEKGKNFHPNQKLTIEEVAKVLVKATQLNENDYASIWLPASNWAQSYMAAALTEGFLSKEDDYRVDAKRSHLVYSLYEVYHFLHPKEGGIIAGSLEPKATISNTKNNDYKWTFTVKNQTEKEQIVNVSGSQFDYILKKDGKKVEQYTDDKMFIMIYKEQTLKQGEELTYTGEFLGLAKGMYELEIWLIDNNWPNAKKTITFEVK
ncbi:BsuPI-related putative proteinase inhibitor [Bacillus sp. CGMCC 1.16607]|uniref:BsuPI-related putative proteinase inhibitor n=1 Tax=Bacillus sp. CGMCC 1.16607 TaxID=3351842 RepID=UPI003630BDFF